MCFPDSLSLCSPDSNDSYSSATDSMKKRIHIVRDRRTTIAGDVGHLEIDYQESTFPDSPLIKSWRIKKYLKAYSTIVLRPSFLHSYSLISDAYTNFSNSSVLVGI